MTDAAKDENISDEPMSGEETTSETAASEAKTPKGEAVKAEGLETGTSEAGISEADTFETVSSETDAPVKTSSQTLSAEAEGGESVGNTETESHEAAEDIEVRVAAATSVAESSAESVNAADSAADTHPAVETESETAATEALEPQAAASVTAESDAAEPVAAFTPYIPQSPKAKEVAAVTDTLVDSAKKRRRVRLIAALVAVVLVIGGGVGVAFSIINSNKAQEAQQSEQSDGEKQPEGDPTKELSFVRRDAADPLAEGETQAPVVLTQFTDLRCPFCAAFERDTFDQIKSNYIESGKVRFEVVPVAYFGEESENAAVAAYAAGNQGKTFEYLRAVFAEAPSSGHPDMPREKLVDFAKKAGVSDLSRFEKDLDSVELHNKVKEQTEFAQQIGVSSVPFFVVGQVALVGAQPYSEFTALIDQALKLHEQQN